MHQGIHESLKAIDASGLLGQCYWAGRWQAGSGKEILEEEPWQGTTVCVAPELTAPEMDQALRFARAAQAGWRARTVEDRGAILRTFADMVKRHARALAQIIAIEAGKPTREAEQEVSALLGKLDASRAALEKRASELLVEAPYAGHTMTIRTAFVPLGVCAVLAPYNFPMHMMNGHIIPALLAGNVVVLKPSEFGIVSALAYTKLMHDAGVPPGVFSFVVGDASAGRALVAHPEIDGVFFTGGEASGSAIRQECAKHNKRCAIEAGGNSVLIVEDFNDLNRALDVVIQSAFWSAGQRCNSARHLIVVDSVQARKLVDVVVERAASLQSARTVDDEQAFYGVLRKPSDKLALRQFVVDLQAAGAKVLHADQENLAKPGSALGAVILEMPSSAAISQEEHMGPVLQVRFVTNLKEAVALANSIKLRLSAGLLSSYPESYAYFRQNAKFGNLTLNCPTANASGMASFGGLGDSGNFSPAGFLSIDYCVTAVSHMEVPLV